MKIEFEHLPVCSLEDLAEAVSDNTGFLSHHIYLTLEYAKRDYTLFKEGNKWN